ncbi:hypothetical protein HK102_003718 [Quaeritorhiza haematococci]|nr:hypothetical protein HK102_003718 [Quaeritorhiza haematococci]
MTVSGIGRERHLSPAKHIPKEMRRLIRLCEAAENDCKFAEACDRMGELVDLFVDTQDWAKVVKHARKMLELARKVPLREGIVKEANLDEYDEALKMHKKYAKKARELNDQVDLWQANFEYGVTLLQRGEATQNETDFHDAKQYFRQCWTDLVQGGSVPTTQEHLPSTKCEVLLNLGIVENNLGSHQSAIECMERALKIALSKGLDDHIQKAYCNLSNSYHRLGDLKKTIEFGQKEIKQCNKTNNVFDRSRAQWYLGLALREAHQYQEALRVHQDYLDDCKVLGDNDGYDRGLEAIRETKDWIRLEEDTQRLGTQLQRFRKEGNVEAEYATLGHRGEAYHKLGKFNEAITDYLAQKKLHPKVATVEGRWEKMTKGLGMAYLGARQYQQAADSFHLLLRSGLSNEERLEVLYILGGIEQQLPTTSYDAQLRTHSEMLNVAVKVGDLRNQHRALHRLVQIHTNYQYFGKATEYRDQLEAVGSMLKEQGSTPEETPASQESEDLGSVDPDAIERVLVEQEKQDLSLPLDAEDFFSLSPAKEPAVTLLGAGENEKATSNKKSNVSKYKVYDMMSDIDDNDTTMKSPRKAFASDDDDSDLPEARPSPTSPKRKKKTNSVPRKRKALLWEKDTSDLEFDEDGCMIVSYDASKRRNSRGSDRSSGRRRASRGDSDDVDEGSDDSESGDSSGKDTPKSKRRKALKGLKKQKAEKRAKSQQKKRIMCIDSSPPDLQPTEKPAEPPVISSPGFEEDSVPDLPPPISIDDILRGNLVKPKPPEQFKDDDPFADLSDVDVIDSSIVENSIDLVSPNTAKLPESTPIRSSNVADLGVQAVEIKQPEEEQSKRRCQQAASRINIFDITLSGSDILPKFFRTSPHNKDTEEFQTFGDKDTLVAQTFASTTFAADGHFCITKAEIVLRFVHPNP